MSAILDDLRAAHNASGEAIEPFNKWYAIGEYIGLIISGERSPSIAHILAIGLNILLMLIIYLLRYTFWEVLATLAIVEAPSPTVGFEWRSDETSEDERPIVSQPPMITSKIRYALSHLYKIGGIMALWRGAGFALIQGIIYMCLFGAALPITGIFHFKGAPFIAILLEELVGFPIALVLTTFRTAFTHVIITQPTFKVWYRRLPPLHTFKHTWWPTLFYTISYEATYTLQRWLMAGFHLSGTTIIYLDRESATRDIIFFWLIWAVSQIFRFGLLVPAGVALVRVQASLLPEDEEPIVPINRTFDRRPAPGILSQPKVVTFEEAWKSFDRLDRARIYFLYAKFVLFELTVRAIFFLGIGRDAWPNLKYLNP